MLKPQQPAPPVFGKPWYSTMDSTRSLARVIMEMRDEIRKLEAENRELRRDSAEENPYVNLRRNVSAPDLDGQYKENNVMTVRRYSISSNLTGVREGRMDGAQLRESGWGRLQEEIQQGNFDVNAAGRGKVTNRHSLQEYIHKNRAKVKTVTFLLPVDDIYTNRPVLTKHQEEPKITETES